MSTSEKQQSNLTADDLDTKSGALTKILTFLKDHYTSLAALSVVIFIGLCLFVSISFYQEFGIEITYFSSFLDIYKAIFSNSAWNLFGQTLLMAMIVAIATRTVAKQNERVKATIIVLANEPIQKNIRRTLFQRILLAADSFPRSVHIKYISIFFILLTALTLIVFPSPVPSRAEIIKLGIASRYDIKTVDNSYKCHALIGATSDYLFLWSFETKHAIIIPKSKLNEIKVVLVVPTIRMPPDVDRIPEAKKDETRREVRKVREKWANDVSSVCKQTFITPTFWTIY